MIENGIMQKSLFKTREDLKRNEEQVQGIENSYNLEVLI